MELTFFPAIFHDAISMAIPQIVDLLKDNDSDVRFHAVSRIGQLAEHCMWRSYHYPWWGWGLSSAKLHDAIWDGIHHIINMLKDSDVRVQETVVSVIGKLAENCMWWYLGCPMMELMFLPAAFHDAISVFIPQILDLLKDSNSNVQFYGAECIGKLTKPRMWWSYHDLWWGWGPSLATSHFAISNVVPHINNMIKDSDPRVRESAVFAIHKLTENCMWDTWDNLWWNWHSYQLYSMMQFV